MSAPSIPAERFSFLPLLCEMLLKVQVGDTQELLRLAQAIQERLASATEHVDSLSGSQLTADQQAELLAGLQLLLQRKSARLGSFQAQQAILRFRAGDGTAGAPNGHAMDTS